MSAEGAADPRGPADGPPSRVPLNGTDWFLLGIDASMRRRTPSGCVCHLVLVLDGPPVVDPLACPWFTWLARLRLVALPPFVLPRWEVRGEPGPTPHLDVDEIDDVLPHLATRLDPARESCVRVTTVGLPNGGGAMVLSWHHALLDARTAEALALAVSGPAAVPSWQPAPPPPLAERLRLARGARDFVWEVSVGGLAAPGGWTRAGRTRHRHLVFEPAEVAEVRARATALGVGLVPSSLHTAACSWAVAELLRRRGMSGDLLVPVPQDRRAGALAPVGNGISLLFFRVPGAGQGDVSLLARQALEQVKKMARDRIPLLMATLLDLCRWLPAWMYMLIVALPTRGRLASFGFSDTGDSLSRITVVAGRSVVDAFHLPANVHPPGLTFVFSQFRGRLQVCVGWAEGVLMDEEVDQLGPLLREALLGPR